MEEEAKKKSLLSRIIYGFFIVALVAFLSFLFIRIHQSSYKALKDAIITDNFILAYEKSQDVRTHATNDEFSENGAVYTYSLVYIPESNYLQLTVRYNKLHIDGVKAAVPELTENDIYYMLLDEGGMEKAPIVVEVTEKYQYKYFKLEFTDVDFTDKVTIRMYLNGVAEGKNEDGKTTLVCSPNERYNSGEVVIHDKENNFIPYEFSKADLEKINKEQE